MKWIAKRLETLEVWDEDTGILITPYSFDGYELGYKTNSNQRPSAKYDILNGPNIDRECAKIEQDKDGNWKVVEDLAKKDLLAARKIELQQALEAIDSYNFNETNWSTITTVAALKAEVRANRLLINKLIRHIRQK